MQLSIICKQCVSPLTVLHMLWKHVVLVEGLQDLQIRLPEVIMGDGYDHTLLGYPDGEVAGGLPRDVKLSLFLMPVVVILLQAVGATFLLMKVEELHCFLNSMVPPLEWALLLNDMCLSNQTTGGTSVGL